MLKGTEVRVIERWQADSFDVYVFPRDQMRESAITSPATIYRYTDGLWALEEIGPHDSLTGMPKPSFSVPTDVMGAMLAASKKLMPSLDRDDAVTDARATRDRLLALVEHSVHEGSYVTNNYGSAPDA
jgi:hypothetical protein